METYRAIGVVKPVKQLTKITGTLWGIVCLLVVVLLVSQPVARVYADDGLSGDDLSAIANGTPFYDPHAKSCSDTGNASLTGADNAAKVFNYFVGKGYSAAQAAGIVGNMAGESSIDPLKWEGDEKDHDPPPTPTARLGWGLVQWTPAQKILDYASRVNKPAGDLGTQVEFLAAQLDGTSPISSEKGAGDALKATTSVEDATTVFEKQYERPSESAAAKSLPFRIAQAKAALAKFGSGSNDGSTVSTQPSSAATSTGCGDIGQYQNPFRDVHNISQAGIDAGVDYSGDGPVYAVGPGIVINANPHSSWVGGNAVSYRLTDGPAKDKVIFVAENCTVSPDLQVDQQVTSNTILCTMHNSYPYIETGWAKDLRNSSLPLAYEDKCYYLANPSIGVKTSTAYGTNFDSFMHRLGAPKASLLGGNVTCTLPTGWPTWQ